MENVNTIYVDVTIIQGHVPVGIGLVSPFIWLQQRNHRLAQCQILMEKKSQVCQIKTRNLISVLLHTASRVYSIHSYTSITAKYIQTSQLATQPHILKEKVTNSYHSVGTAVLLNKSNPNSSFLQVHYRDEQSWNAKANETTRQYNKKRSSKWCLREREAEEKTIARNRIDSIKQLIKDKGR